jgi:hypothetical protein
MVDDFTISAALRVAVAATIETGQRRKLRGFIRRQSMSARKPPGNHFPVTLPQVDVVKGEPVTAR